MNFGSRAERAQSSRQEPLERNDSDETPHGETSVYQDSNGDMVATTRHPDGTVETQGYEVNGNSSFKNRFIDAVGQQFHNIVDNYVPADLNVMDSVLTKRLNDRYIYPDFVLTEVVDSLGTVVVNNSNEIPARHDSFLYRYNPISGYTYRAYITPLTRHIISEMAGSDNNHLFCSSLAFSLAFLYLFSTVSRFGLSRR